MRNKTVFVGSYSSNNSGLKKFGLFAICSSVVLKLETLWSYCYNSGSKVPDSVLKFLTMVLM